jgi:hypothetical protein
LLILRLNLPHELLDVASELGFLTPTETLESLADVGLDIGSEGTGTVMVFVIAFTGIDADEVVLHCPLDAARHVVVTVGETVGHADGSVVAVFRAVAALHLGVVEVDAGDTTLVFSNIVAEDVAEAMVATRTDRAVAYDVSGGFLAEDFFARLRGILFLFHNMLLFDGAKIVYLLDICK